MRNACFLLLLAATASLASCDSSSPKTCVNTCDQKDPDAQHCGVQWTLDAGCTGYVEFAEIAVDQCLEPTNLHAGETLKSCARIEVGHEFLWTVRGKSVASSVDWEWGPYKDACVKGGAYNLVYALSCK